jgi:hypothetical protein
MSDTSVPEKLRPARGIILGLFLGALLWIGIGTLAWFFFR